MATKPNDCTQPPERVAQQQPTQQPGLPISEQLMLAGRVATNIEQGVSSLRCAIQLARKLDTANESISEMTYVADVVDKLQENMAAELVAKIHLAAEGGAA